MAENFTPWKAGDKKPVFAPGARVDIKDAKGNVFKNHTPYEGVFWGHDSNIVGYRVVEAA